MNNSEKKNGNLRTMILSLLIAIVLWVVIGIVQDPDVHGTVANIPVEYTNMDELAANGLVVVPKLKSEITAEISGKRREIMEGSRYVKCVVDVSGIRDAGEYTLEGTVTATNSRVTIEKGRSANVTVNIELLETKEFDVTAKQTGSAKGMLVRSVPGISKVKVTGAKSEIEKISRVEAQIDITAITQDTDRIARLFPVGENGAALQNEATLSMEILRTNVTNTVYAKKTLPVKLRLSQKLVNEYWLDEKSSTVSDAAVEVGLRPDATAECVYLNINSADAQTYKLTEEEGMYIPPQSLEMSANIKLVKKQQRHMDITLHAENTPEGLSVTMPEKLTGLLVYAPEDVLNANDIKGKVNLQGKTAGTYRIKVEMDDERVTAAEDIYADVVIK